MPTSETDSALETSPWQTLTKSGNKDTVSSKSGPTSKGNTEVSEDSPVTPQGHYIKIGQEEDMHCGCYCLDINFNSISELCLSPDTIYIQVRFEMTDSNLIEVYLTAPSDRNSQGEKISWDLFDRDRPIAIISPSSSGELDLDWLGFSIKGELAMDYAIFGKKTLEGKFKKK